ncbi:MAG: NAD(P)-dependent oxidoreductase [Pseudomonadota bacterium]
MKIGFLGTGLMGAPMVRRLAAAGHELVVWNRSRDKAEALEDCALVAKDAAGVASGADLTISMLMDGPATRDVLSRQGVIEEAIRGATIIDMASVDPATDRDLAAVCAERGLAFLDAPVSGGVVGAEEGTLSIFVGGSAETFERARTILAAMGRPTHLGPVGSGQVTKLANQMIVAGTIGAVAEGLRLAEAGGCSPPDVRQALMGGFADSRILDLHGQRMVDGNYEPGGRSVAQLKDLNNALDEAALHDLSLPVAETVQAAFRDFVVHHDGADLDHSAYHHWLKVKR